MAEKFKDGEIVQVEKKGFGSRIVSALGGALKWGAGGAVVGGAVGAAIGTTPDILEPAETAAHLTMQALPDGIAQPIYDIVSQDPDIAGRAFTAVGGAEIGAAAGAAFGAGKGFAAREELRHLEAVNKGPSR